ncbi:TIGR04066 family peptide maturation system protein [Zongyangia hominis]|uniref:TIGR04066 family peptide maturation system protein n=1 Tax=Zongyangia hominis TaxID=2763677 RepID=A0A926ED07_9FIRM|nr:TIGR04066 family peptide maturation system protein [Zongyangia hominis]MBC8569871.1 TIGR04066 family peptide maturation system protein [Zongyangia hominis]
MKKLTLFPCNADAKILLDYPPAFKDYEITALSDFAEHSARLDAWEKRYGIYADADADRVLERSDALLLCDNIENLRFDKYKRLIEKAAKAKKEILLTPRLARELGELPSVKTNLLYRPYPIGKGLSPQKVYQITVPVIAVMGMGENCDKFETMLIIKDVLEKKGYAPVCLAANSLGPLFGMYSLPLELNSEQLSMEQKVLILNHMVHQLCKESPSDVIVVELPGGIGKIGDKEYNHFSEISLAIAGALSVDVGIMNLYFNDRLTSEDLEQFRLLCRWKYEIEVEAFVLSRQKIEYDDEQLRFEYLHLSDELRKKLLPSYLSSPCPIADIGDKAGVREAIAHLIAILEGNLAAV